MKKINVLFIIGLLILSSTFILSGCKKKSTTPEVSAPTFVMSSAADPAILNDVFFYFKCTTNDVKLTKIVVSDPIGVINDIYDLQSATALQNVVYQLNNSYPKESGTWTFKFTGNRASDNSGFVSTTTLVLSK